MNWICDDTSRCVKVQDYPLFLQKCNNIPNLCGQLICYANQCAACREQEFRQDGKYVCYQGKFVYNFTNSELKYGIIAFTFTIFFIVTIQYCVTKRRVKKYEEKIRAQNEASHLKKCEEIKDTDESVVE